MGSVYPSQSFSVTLMGRFYPPMRNILLSINVPKSGIATLLMTNCLNYTLQCFTVQ